MAIFSRVILLLYYFFLLLLFFFSDWLQGNIRLTMLLLYRSKINNGHLLNSRKRQYRALIHIHKNPTVILINISWNETRVLVAEEKEWGRFIPGYISQALACSPDKREHIARIEAEPAMREWRRLEREQTVDGNLTVIHQSANCVVSGEKKSIKK